MVKNKKSFACLLQNLMGIDKPEQTRCREAIQPRSNALLVRNVLICDKTDIIAKNTRWKNLPQREIQT